MLRYHPSLEFRPSPAPSQSTAVVLYDPELLMVSQQAPSREVDVETVHDRKNTLKSLLDFARHSNERQRATLTLAAFMKRVQDEQAEVEAALEKQTIAAATSLVLSLVNTRRKDTEHAHERKPNDCTKQSLQQSSIKAVSTVPIAPRGSHQRLTDSHKPHVSVSKHAVIYQIRERLQTFQPGEDATKVYRNVQKIRKEIQQAYRGFAENARQTEKEFRMKLILRSLLEAPSLLQSQQTIVRRIRSKLELIRDINLNVWSFKATGGLADIIEWELKDVTNSTMTVSLYSVEVLLEPWSVKAVMPQNSIMTQIPSQQQEPHDDAAQRGLTDLRTEKIFADATTQTFPCSVDTVQQEAIQGGSTCPILETSLSIIAEPSSQSLRPVSVKEKSDNVQLTSLGLASRTELQERAVPRAPKLSKMGEQTPEGATKAAAEQRKEASKVPIEATVTRIARKKEPQASNGTDAFLSLLDLVRKR